VDTLAKEIKAIRDQKIPELKKQLSSGLHETEQTYKAKIAQAQVAAQKERAKIQKKYDEDVRIGKNFTATKAGNWAVKFAEGGPVSGGTPNADSVRAMLMPGEYVVRKAVVERMGQGFFDRLNNGPWKKFAEGGPVGTAAQADTVNVNLNLGGKTFGLSAGRSTAADLVRELRRSGLAGA
jgi:hypothetical protein